MIDSTLFKDFPHGFGTKEDGDGRDSETLQKVLQDAGVTYQSIIRPQQTHSTHVEIISSSNIQNTHPQADGLVTQEAWIILSVLTADCVPIIYADKSAGVIGISHGGWKGTLENIVSSVISSMIKLGATQRNIRVSIGPHIGTCCYEMYGDRMSQFENKFSKKSLKEHDNKTYLDLTESNVMLLQQAGIRQEHIEVIDQCTSCHTKDFFSYHRDKGISGEMVSFIMLKETR